MTRAEAIEAAALPARIWDKIAFEPMTGCWLWSGAAADGGYGRVWLNGRMEQAHRVVYAAHRGPISHGLECDHLCRTPACVNPDHIELVTTRENLLRGRGHTAINAAKSRCANGHEFTPENTRIKYGWRQCRACDRERAARKREAAPDPPEGSELDPLRGMVEGEPCPLCGTVTPEAKP
jgi:hypothetical protein